VSTPPARTPTAAPEPPIAPQIPSALLRSAPSSKVVMMIERAAGEMIAAPRPWSARAAIRTFSDHARPHRKEARVNTATPTRKTRRRPNRSAARPPSNRKPPNVIAYAVITHWRLSREKSSASPIDGSATFTIETSRTVMKKAAQTSASAFQRRGSGVVVAMASPPSLVSRPQRGCGRSYSGRETMRCGRQTPPLRCTLHGVAGFVLRTARGFRLRALVALVLVGVTAVSCVSSERESSPEPCRPGTASPIAERLLTKTLRQRGFAVHRADQCDGDPRTLVQLEDTSGILFCDVLEKDIFGPRIERFVWRNDPRPTYLRVLNVDCAIYPERSGDADRLERAFRALPSVSAQPTGVPSADAVHD
jgi:hypothetical protein